MKYKINADEIVFTLSKEFIVNALKKFMFDGDKDVETRIVSAYLAGKLTDEDRASFEEEYARDLREYYR